MTNTLLIVESPGKVQTISKFLGPDYTVRPTVGHIIDLAKGRGGGDVGVDIHDGFKPRYEVMHDKRDKIKAIVDAAKTADLILVASDDDREGEAIAFHVLSQIEKLGKPIKRIVFNEITKEAIEKSIKNPTEFNQDLYDAQQARRVLDRIVGFMVSPYISKKLNNKLSAGRVQSVALRIVVDKEREVEAFIPKTFWNLSAELVKDGSKFTVKYPKRVGDEEQANDLVKDIGKSELSVTSVAAKKQVREPLPPLTTSMLLQEGSSKLKFKTERTMRAAQQLYEGGHVTYIRTDSTRNSEGSIEGVRKYLSDNGHEIPKEPNTFQNKDASQDAHEAIRPTKIDAHPTNIALSGDLQKVYNLIWRMFVASQMKPALFDVVKLNVKASEVYRALVAEGKILREAGWLDIAKPFVKKDKDVVLPALKKDDTLELSCTDPLSVKMEKAETKPPARYNEATLVKELERKGIGRPSTFAAITSRITNRKYVKSTSKGLYPSELGCTITDDLIETFSFMDVMYTANMEKSLDLIAKGKLGYVEMMTEFFDGFREEFQKARGSQGMHAGIACPECGGDTVVRKSKYGFFAGCIKYPECKGIESISIEDGKVLQKGQRSKILKDVKCPDCNSGMIPRPDGRFGPFYSCSEYPQCKGKRKMPFGKKCSKCNSELYVNLMSGVMKLACMGYPDCKNVEDLPEDADTKWLDPKKVTPPTYNNKVEKVLKKK